MTSTPVLPSLRVGRIDFAALSSARLVEPAPERQGGGGGDGRAGLEELSTVDLRTIVVAHLACLSREQGMSSADQAASNVLANKSLRNAQPSRSVDECRDGTGRR